MEDKVPSVCIHFNCAEENLSIRYCDMKLTDELKKKIDNAASDEEVKAILENVKGGAEAAGIILDDEELDQASGGYMNEGKDGFPNITPGNQIHTH